MALSGWIKPQLTRLVDQAPDGPEWLHEFKFDGYRMHARLDRGAVRLLTRTGLDWTHKYQAVAAAVASLSARQAYLDGELCGVRPDGTASFSLIQNASDTGNSGALVFFLFDLLHLDGEAIGAMPVRERKERLRALLSDGGFRDVLEIPGFPAAVPKVRVHLPPGQNLRTIGSAVQSPAVRAAPVQWRIVADG